MRYILPLSFFFLAACALPPVQDDLSPQPPTSDTGSSVVSIDARYDGKIVYTTDADADVAALEQDCEERKGYFEECGSPCPPDADTCIEVCAFTCTTPKAGDDSIIWETYYGEEIGFSMKYRNDMEVRVRDEQGHSVHFSYWGPTQEENTEFYDGISISVREGQYGDELTLEGLIEENMEDVRKVGTILEDIHEVSVGSEDGLAFSAESLGQYTTVFIQKAPQRYVQITYRAPDPTNVGHEKAMQRMLDSFTLE